MPSYIVNGGKQLHGSIKVNTAKNSAVALLASTLLVKAKVSFFDMPRMADVEQMLDILSSIGVKYVWNSESSITVDTSGKLHPEKMDKEACAKMRSSLLLLGALSKRVKKYQLYRSGGCKLGERSVRPHSMALSKLGVEMESKKNHFQITNKSVKGSKIIMYEAGDTPTENTIMAAVLTLGVTEIKFASANYMVQDLCHFLNAAGAKISGIGTSTLIITGVAKLRSVKSYHIMPDPLEAMAFVATAITTHSNLTIKNCPLDFLELELEKLLVMGQKYKLLNPRKSQNGKFNIVDIKIIKSDLKALQDKIHGMPFPGINIDNVPFFVPICTQAKGRTLIHDWVFENRTTYYLAFRKLGVEVDLLDPHRVIVEGVAKLKSRDLSAPSGIRPAMAILIGLIAAKGVSKLDDIYYVERGYQNLPERLRKIGVDIERVD